jgi:hypothetical protein
VSPLLAITSAIIWRLPNVRKRPHTSTFVEQIRGYTTPVYQVARLLKARPMRVQRMDRTGLDPTTGAGVFAVHRITQHQQAGDAGGAGAPRAMQAVGVVPCMAEARRAWSVLQLYGSTAWPSWRAGDDAAPLQAIRRRARSGDRRGIGSLPLLSGRSFHKSLMEIPRVIH